MIIPLAGSTASQLCLNELNCLQSSRFVANVCYCLIEVILGREVASLSTLFGTQTLHYFSIVSYTRMEPNLRCCCNQLDRNGFGIHPFSLISDENRTENDEITQVSKHFGQ